jgi:hypothetical protein
MEATTQRILELTASEKRKLQNLILGYGKLKKHSAKANVHRHTLRNVARLGYGEPETIEKLRSTILS